MNNISYQDLVGDFKFSYNDDMEFHYSADGLEFATHEQLLVFETLKEQINNCYKKSTSLKKQIKSLEFCFTTHGTLYVEDALYTFNTMCDLLDINPDIVHIRLMYELYLQKSVLPIECLNSNIRIPDDFISEILLSTRDLNLMPAIHYIYTHPSVKLTQVCAMFNGIDTQLEQLILDGYIINNDDHLYFIGKNPATINNFKWSCLF